MLTVTAAEIRALAADEAAIVKMMIDRSKELHDQNKDVGKRRALINNYKQVVEILVVAMPGNVANEGPFEDEAALRDCVRCELWPARAFACGVRGNSRHARFGMMMAAAAIDRDDDLPVERPVERWPLKGLIPLSVSYETARRHAEAGPWLRRSPATTGRRDSRLLSLRRKSRCGTLGKVD
jgi:hypothetical protein